MMNEKDIELEFLYGYVEQNYLKELYAQVRRYLAEILLNIYYQHLAEAEDWPEKAIDSEKQNGMLGDIRGHPNENDLLDVENRVNGLLAGLAAWMP